MSEPGSEPAPAEPAFSGSYKRGPHLDGLLSRAPGAVAGFPYRFIFKIEGPTWTEADLDYYIYNHARLDDASRADLVAYLKKSTSR